MPYVYNQLERKISGTATLGFVLVSLFFVSQQSVQAQSVLDPLIDSLSFKQRQEQMVAAPFGRDEPLEPPSSPLQLTAEIRPTDEASTLEITAIETAEIVSLEDQVQTQELQRSELKQFGYDLFASAPTTFTQVEDLPVPEDYRVGPGDSLIVQLYGKDNVEYSLVVTRDGKLLLPELGPMEISGMTFEEVKEGITHRYTSQVIGVRTVVSMNKLRTIQIRLTGEVVQPGTFTVSSLATLVDALLNSGGVKNSGSLRRIQLKRGGRTVTEFDLYDLLMRGDTDKDAQLQHNDVLFVPPISEVVYLGGEVQRPAIYELRGETLLAQVIQLAGGMLPTASIENSHIERIVDRRYRTLIDFIPTSDTAVSPRDFPEIEIQGGDFIRVLPVSEAMDEVVLLSGHVKHPGGYQLSRGAMASDLFASKEQIIPNTDLDFALLIREQAATRRTEVEFIDLSALLQSPNSHSDLSLQPRDELRLFNLDEGRAETLETLVSRMQREGTEYRPARIASVLGAARHPGRYPLPEGIRLLEFLRISGGISAGTDLGYSVIARTEYPSTRVKLFSVSLAAAMAQRDGDHNALILPGDRIYLFDDSIDRSDLMKDDLARLAAQASYSSPQRTVRINGLVNHPGNYPLEDNMRASDLVCAARGLSLTAYGLEAELSRYEFVGGDRRQLDHIVLSAQDVAALCEQKLQRELEIQQDDQELRLEKFGTIEVEGARIEVVDIIDPVFFRSGNSQVSTKDMQQLRDAIAYYREDDRRVILTVTGHTDSTAMGAASRRKYGDNYGLSYARAREVAAVLSTELGMGIYEIEQRGFGGDFPLASNATDEGRALNRRVEVSLLLESEPAASPSAASGSPGQGSYEATALTMDMQSAIDPLLQPHDQLTFVQKPNWIPEASIELTGEVMRPGTYVINRGETLCEVMSRAGGVTADAYVFGARFTRRSIRALQQQTLDNIQDQLDDILVQLSMSHSARNYEKTPSGDSKDEYLNIIKQLERANPSGRLVIDLERVLSCDEDAVVALEDGDRLDVPTRPNYVNVAGQVYVPTSHMFRENRSTEDYIELSGGATVIGRLKHSYVVQANGEVMSYHNRRSSRQILRATIQPGAEIIVPLNLDRMNLTERVQSWTRSLLDTALFAGVLF